MIHVTIKLEWIGKDCPSFWTNNRLDMRVSFEPKYDWFNEAILIARKTWHEHEAKIVNVVLRKSIID